MQCVTCLAESIIQRKYFITSILCFLLPKYVLFIAKAMKVERYLTPEHFAHWQRIAEDMGFLYVASGPLVRSSYKAGEFFINNVLEQRSAYDASLLNSSASVTRAERTT